MKTISKLEDLIAMLKQAKADKVGGQFVSIYCKKPVDLKKGGRCGLAPIREDFKPVKSFSWVYNFGANYDNKVQALLNRGAIDEAPEKDEERRKNIEHLVGNVLIRYKSTGTTCFYVIATNYHDDGLTLNGEPLTEEDLAYLELYKKAKKANPIGIFTISIQYAVRLKINGEEYNLELA